MKNFSDFGLLGLGVMGANLARNVASRNFKVSVFNRSFDKTEEFITEFGSENLVGEKTLASFVNSIKRPRKIMIMVKAGQAVDEVIKSLQPLLEKGDIIIDGGNSNYLDTRRRFVELKKVGLNFMGCGVSGGEDGALNGPSLMPGGNKESWNRTRKIFEAIAAKDFSGFPCVTFVGEGGAGHFVKMVHNGIEYAVMQILADTYSVYRDAYGLPANKIGDIFSKMNKGKLNSFLFEIAGVVLQKKDETDGKIFLVDRVLDLAGSKGTGKWTSEDSLNRGVSLPTITQAVFERYASTKKNERVVLQKKYPSRVKTPMGLVKFNSLIEDALFAAIISSYAQGFELIKEAAREEKWKIDLAEVARIWQGGCIVRAKFLETLHTAYEKNKDDDVHMFALPQVVKILKPSLPALRELVSATAMSGVSTPCLSSALYYFESASRARSSANLIQAMRDYFGAHTYERTDRKGVFHSSWHNNEKKGKI